MQAISETYRSDDPTRGPVTTRTERDRDRAQAIAALTAGRSVVYAMRLPGDTIKIGCSRNLASRRRCVHADAEILGFMFGEYDDEQAIHAALRSSRERGREYYRPTPEVLAVVNQMRDEFNLPHITS